MAVGPSPARQTVICTYRRNPVDSRTFACGVPPSYSGVEFGSNIIIIMCTRDWCDLQFQYADPTHVRYRVWCVLILRIQFRSDAYQAPSMCLYWSDISCITQLHYDGINLLMRRLKTSPPMELRCRPLHPCPVNSTICWAASEFHPSSLQRSILINCALNPYFMFISYQHIIIIWL